MVRGSMYLMGRDRRFAGREPELGACGRGPNYRNSRLFEYGPAAAVSP
jgi:hypothetical protein